MQDGYNADELYGDLSQAQRDFVMGRFRTKHLQMLVANDVAASGIDIIDLTHVINFNLPDDPEIYVHRSGRTGRAGKKGISLSIVHSRELNKIRQLESMTRKKFNKNDVPSGNQICETQLFNLVDRVKNIEIDNHQIEQYLPDIYSKLEHLERDELIKHFVSVEFNRFLSYYKNAKDLNVSVSNRRDDNRRDDNRRGDRNDRGERGGERGGRSGGRNGDTKFSRFHINIGSKDNINPPHLIGMINDVTPGLKVEIGKIDILRNFSFFDADSTYEKEILNNFQNQSRGELELSVTLSKGKPESDNRERRGNSDFGDKRGKPRYSDGNSGNKRRRTRKRD